MTDKKKVISFLLTVLICSIMLWSAFYIANETGHDCIGEDCPICYQLSVCQNNINRLSTVVCSIICTFFFISKLRNVKLSGFVFFSGNTLVSLKVKLTD